MFDCSHNYVFNAPLHFLGQIIYLHMIIWYQVFLSNRLIGLVGRGFANDLGGLGSIPGRVIPKTLKMVLDTSLLNTKQYNVRIKGKVEQFRVRSDISPLCSFCFDISLEKANRASQRTKTKVKFVFITIIWQIV